MKARVYVTMKTTVLDPQGQTVCRTLTSLGHKSISDVRQGKYFEILIAEGASQDQVRTEVEQIAHDVLANPVIEDYRIEIVD